MPYLPTKLRHRGRTTKTHTHTYTHGGQLEFRPALRYLLPSTQVLEETLRLCQFAILVYDISEPVESKCLQDILEVLHGTNCATCILHLYARTCREVFQHFILFSQVYMVMHDLPENLCIKVVELIKELL